MGSSSETNFYYILLDTGANKRCVKIYREVGSRISLQYVKTGGRPHTAPIGRQTYSRNQSVIVNYIKLLGVRLKDLLIPATINLT